MTLFDLPVPLSTLRKRAYNHRWATVPEDVIPLTAADPDFLVAPPIVDAIRCYISEGIFSYGPDCGLHEFREAVARYYRERKSVVFSPEDVLAVDGAARGLSIACKAVLQPGDEAIIFDPVDFLFQTAVESAGANAIRLRYDRESQRFPLEHLPILVSHRTRALCLCNPHNPLGLVLSKEELKLIADFAESHELVVINDEIWSDIVYPGTQFSSIMTGSEAMRRQCITVTGFSKNFALAGLRIGAMIVPDELLMAKVRQTGEFKSTVGGCATLSQVAATAALTDGWEWFSEFLSHLHRMRDLAFARLKALPNVEVRLPEATYVLFADLSAYGPDALHVCSHIYNHGRVALVPGSQEFFGPGAQGHVRLCFATHESLLLEATCRIGNALKGLEHLYLDR